MPRPMNARRERKVGESHRCYQGAHDQCSGFLSPKHGLRPVCTCKCHINKESTEAPSNHGKQESNNEIHTDA